MKQAALQGTWLIKDADTSAAQTAFLICKPSATLFEW